MDRFIFSTLLLISACEPSEESDVSVSQEGDEIVVNIESAPAMFIETCMTPVVELAQVNDDGSLSELETDVEDIADQYSGYWLDGEFVYPSLDEGCDMVMCVQLESNPSERLISYAVTGEDVPPDDLEAWLEENGGWMEVATSVSVVESVVITGDLEVSLSFYEEADCSGELQVLTLETSVD